MNEEYLYQKLQNKGGCSRLTNARCQGPHFYFFFFLRALTALSYKGNEECLATDMGVGVAVAPSDVAPALPLSCQKIINHFSRT